MSTPPKHGQYQPLIDAARSVAAALKAGIPIDNKKAAKLLEGGLTKIPQRDER